MFEKLKIDETNGANLEIDWRIAWNQWYKTERNCTIASKLFSNFLPWLSSVPFSRFLGIISKGVLYSKMLFWSWIWLATLVWMILWKYDCCFFLRSDFFHDYVFPDRVFADNQPIQKNEKNYIDLCWWNQGEKSWTDWTIAWNQWYKTETG